MSELIIDTCCLLNLFASDEPKAILRHFGGVHVSEHVQIEALWIREYDCETPPQMVPKQIDLTECIDDGVITICRLEKEAEFELFLQFAQHLDDGEASVLAIAKARGWNVATDDKKALRIASEHQIRTISTSEMLHGWTASQNKSVRQIGAILLNIQRFSRFLPRRTDAYYQWWTKTVEASEESD